MISCVYFLTNAEFRAQRQGVCRYSEPVVIAEHPERPTLIQRLCFIPSLQRYLARAEQAHRRNLCSAGTTAVSVAVKRITRDIEMPAWAVLPAQSVLRTWPSEERACAASYRCFSVIRDSGFKPSSGRSDSL